MRGLTRGHTERGWLKSLIVQGQMYPIPQNLAPNVNLSYCMDLWTLGSKLQKIIVGHFSNDL